MSSRESVIPRPLAIRLGYRRLPMRAIAVFLATTAFVMVMTTHLIDFGVDGLRVRLLNADSDASWSHMLGAATLVAGTIVALVSALRARDQRITWGVAATVLAFLSVDEISSLHTQVDRFSWGKAVYAPILLLLCVCLWRLSAETRHRLVVRAGLVTLVLSFAVHVFGPHVLHALGLGTKTWAYQVKVALKEGAELAGWLLVVCGLLSLGPQARR